MDDGEGIGVAFGKRGGGGVRIGETVVEGLVHGAIEADVIAGVADGGGWVTGAVEKCDSHAGTGRDFHDAGPGTGVIGELDGIGQAGGGCLVKDAAFEGDSARQGQGIGPAFGLPGGVLGGVVAAAVAVEETNDDGALVALLWGESAGGGVGTARAGEIVAEVHAAEAGDHGKSGALQPADEVAGDVAAAAL